LAKKDEEFDKETEACKQDVAQAYLVEAVVEQASGLYPGIDYTQLGPGKNRGRWSNKG